MATDLRTALEAHVRGGLRPRGRVLSAEQHAQSHPVARAWARLREMRRLGQPLTPPPQSLPPLP